MCDYSLMGMPNRLANEGEDLIVYRFPTGTIGLTEFLSPLPQASATVQRGVWARIREFICGSPVQSQVAVCIPPGTRLLLGDISEGLRRAYKIGSVEEVTFTQFSAAENTHRDAIRLRNGRHISLQQLRAGQRVRILQLTIPEDIVAAGSARRNTLSSTAPSPSR
jgi:hypothetical protein